MRTSEMQYIADLPLIRPIWMHWITVFIALWAMSPTFIAILNSSDDEPFTEELADNFDFATGSAFRQQRVMRLSKSSSFRHKIEKKCYTTWKYKQFNWLKANWPDDSPADDQWKMKRRSSLHFAKLYMLNSVDDEELSRPRPSLTLHDDQRA